MQISVLDAATLDFEGKEWAPIEALGTVTFHELTPYETSAIVENTMGSTIALTNKVPFGREVFDRLPELRMIGVLATGYNIIDLDAARDHGVTVCNVPAYSTTSVVQHTVALMLELCNQVGWHNHTVHVGDWVRSARFSYWKQPVLELSERTVGFIGFGDIGRRVAEAVHALGANVVAYSPSRRNAPEWTPFAWREVDEIFRIADIVSLHCPQTPETTGFVNTTRLSAMKPGSFLVNTARGGLINEVDLAGALREGIPAAAALDVVSAEPMRPDNPLLDAPNCILTPHMAWCSLPSRIRLVDTTRQNIEAFLAGSPANVVTA